MHTQRKDMPKGDILIAILNTKNQNFNKETPLLSQTKCNFQLIMSSHSLSNVRSRLCAQLLSLHIWGVHLCVCPQVSSQWNLRIEKVDDLHSQRKAAQEGPYEPSLFGEHLWRVESTSIQSQGKELGRLWSTTCRFYYYNMKKSNLLIW